VVIEVAGARSKDVFWLAMFIEAGFAETSVRADIVVLETQAMLDQRRTRKGVIADTVTPHPGIQ
jgi:hypothetical protein